YLANLPAKTDLRTLAATIKARWICEQAHQQMKEELGLDHRFPPTSPARNSKTGKKESTGRRLNRPCPPCATPFSNFSLDYRRSDARIVENGFAASSGMSKSAKVVLGPVLINRPAVSAFGQTGH